MRFERLRIDGLRSLSNLSIELDPGINLFVGGNGAGKTSVLEAAFLLSHGRSFRTGAREALIQRNAASLSIFAELRRADERMLRLGLGRTGARWEARIDSATESLGTLVRECAVVCFEPGSHALIAGAAEERRRYMDWGVFHVEPKFLDEWRRYQRALKQRNSLLRSAESSHESLFSPWEREMAAGAAWIDGQRRGYLDQLLPLLRHHAGQLLPELGAMELGYRRGWSEERDLAELLIELRGRDSGRGHTGIGPHRADWSVVFEHAPLREHLSRGQEKLTALACLLAQAELYATVRGDWPVLCLDDLASELDQEHQAALVTNLRTVQAQVLVTGTEVPASLETIPQRRFHVEQGKATCLL